MSNLYAQSPRFPSSQAIETMAAARRQFAAASTIKAMESLNRLFAASPTIKAMESLSRQFAASPTIKAMESLSRQFASSPTIKAMESLSRQFASSPTIKAMESLSRQFASSPTIKAIESLNRQFASSPTIKAMESLNRQLASSPTIKAIESLNRQLASRLNVEKAIFERWLDPTLISTPRMPSVPVEASIRSPRGASTVVKARRRPQVCDFQRVGYLDSEKVRSRHNTAERLQLFDSLVTDLSLRRTCRKLFADGHYAVAVERAFICLNKMVRVKSELDTQDGAGLMRTAFSANSPILYLNAFQSESEKNEQLGYMDIYAGAMTGIRNPRSHEHDIEDDPQVALELLVIANHLMRKLNGSTRDHPPPGNLTP